MRVLIVDDDPIALELLRDMLSDAGHEVESADDGAQGLAAVKRFDFDVVITDWEMPGLDGPAFCRAIRTAGTATYVYVILLTSHSGLADRVAGLSAGADDFMSKPFNPDELMARLQAAERIVSLETRDVAIFAMAKLAESRDPETGAHLERVQSYCRVLGQHLLATSPYRDQIDHEFVRLLYSTSPLHDIGKVGIPDGVLLKPGRLSDREFDIMKSHTTIGAETLDAALKRFPNAKFLRMARDIAASHHERFDGTGYPSKLAGEQIPLCGRVLAVADVYDALCSRRVYKEAFTHSIAKDIILKDTGTHFDPIIVAAFEAEEEEFIAIHMRHRESNLAA